MKDKKQPTVFPKGLDKETHAGDEIVVIIGLVMLALGAVLTMEHFLGR